MGCFHDTVTFTLALKSENLQYEFLTTCTKDTNTILNVANLTKKCLSRDRLRDYPIKHIVMVQDIQIVTISTNSPTTGEVFRSTNDEAMKTWLDEIFESRPGGFYSQGINKLVKHWQENRNSEGEYISLIL